MIKQIRYWVGVFLTAGKCIFQEKYTYRASALAFTTLLSLVPLLSVIVSVIALFPFFKKFINLAEDYILQNFIPTSNLTIQYYLNNFVQQATHLSMIGIFFLFFAAVMLIITVEHSINDIWDVPRRKKQFSSMLVYWAVLILTPLFIGLSVFLSSYLFSLGWFGGTASRLGLKIPLLASLPLLINTMIFSVLYIVVPNCPVKWKNGLVGGLVAAILFELAKNGFAFYIQQFPSYELIYGALATVPIFLVWIYISWLIVLFGALITRIHQQKSRFHQ